MAITEESDEYLQKRKNLLDSTLMNLLLCGMETPPELEEEFTAVQNELIRRNVQFLPLSDENAWTNWLGKEIGDYKIEHLVEEGLYWYLFNAPPLEAAEGKVGLGPAMFRIAKTPAQYGIKSGTVHFPTRTFSIDADIVREVKPSQNALSDAEVQRLATVCGALQEEGEDLSAILPRIDEVGSCSFNGQDVQYYRAAFFPGETLRDLLEYGTGRHKAFEIVSLFSQIVGTLDLVLHPDRFPYHGNLKPENIVFTAGGVYFRELGDFGALGCGDVLEPEVRTTTPQYYPWLDVDDIGALGICLWEALTDVHPFDENRAVTGDCQLGNDLRALVDLELSLSNMFVLPLLNMKRPHQLGINTSEALETVLFKSLKMRIGEDGLIYEDDGYESMAAFNDALLDLLNGGEMIF